MSLFKRKSSKSTVLLDDFDQALKKTKAQMEKDVWAEIERLLPYAFKDLKRVLGNFIFTFEDYKLDETNHVFWLDFKTGNRYFRWFPKDASLAYLSPLSSVGIHLVKYISSMEDVVMIEEGGK
jgi:hypothetical protein